MGIFGAGLRSPITESLRRQPQSLNPQVFARRQESTLTPQRRTVGRVLADLITPKTREGAQWARKVSGALDWTSPTGADQPAQDAVAEFKKGNYGTSGLLGVLAAASLVPGVGTEAKTGKGLLGKFFEAYHGSPHKFDRFSLDKIGTGEGAAAYGHGLYFAENEGVAKQYRDQLANDGFLTSSGKIWSPDELGHKNIKVIARRNGTNLGDTIAYARQIADEGGPVAHIAADDLSRLEALHAAGGIMPNSGSMYHVKINADPAHFLNWDAPVANQSPYVRDALGSAGIRNDDYAKWTINTTPAGNHIVTDVWGQPARRFKSLSEAEQYAAERTAGHNSMGGSALYGELVNKGANRSAPAASNLLKEAGIPGISYLDQGSRSAGLGTRNHVVFDDSLIEILKRYGIVPPALVGGGMAAQQQNQMPQ